MGGARELTDRWSHLSVSAGEEMDSEQTRDHYLQFVVSMKSKKKSFKPMESPKHFIHLSKQTYKPVCSQDLHSTDQLSPFLL